MRSSARPCNPSRASASKARAGLGSRLDSKNDKVRISTEANLKFARQVAQLDAPQLKWFEAVSAWLPPNAWVWLAGATALLSVGLLVLPGICRRRKAWWAAVAGGAGVRDFSVQPHRKFRGGEPDPNRFRPEKNTPLRLTPTQDGEVISTLAPGEPVRRLVRSRGKYIFIRTLGDMVGQQSDFGPLRPR